MCTNSPNSSPMWHFLYSVLMETGEISHTFFFVVFIPCTREEVKPVLRLIPQKHSLVFIKCFFLALRENKEKSKYSKERIVVMMMLMLMMLITVMI